MRQPAHGGRLSFSLFEIAASRNRGREDPDRAKFMPEVFVWSDPRPRIVSVNIVDRTLRAPSRGSKPTGDQGSEIDSWGRKIKLAGDSFRMPELLYRASVVSVTERQSNALNQQRVSLLCNQLRQKAPSPLPSDVASCAYGPRSPPPLPAVGTR